MNYGKLTAGTTKTAIDTAKPSEKGEIITYLSRMGDVLDDIQERSKIIVLLIGAVHTAVHGDETDIMFGEKHFRVKTDFQIVSSDTAHILCNDNTDLVVLYQFDHAVPIGAVEVSTGVTIVHKKLDVSETLFFCVFLENRLLR